MAVPSDPSPTLVARRDAVRLPRHARRVGAALVLVLTGCASEHQPITLDTVATTEVTTSTSSAVVNSPGPVLVTSASVAPTSASIETTSSSAAATVPTTLPPLTPQNAPLIEWDGRQTYVHGANLPWFNFGRDFGGGASDGGVSAPDVRTAVSEALGKAHDAGMNVVRWWVFPGEPTQFTVDAQGLPTGLKPQVYADLDAALAIGRQNDIAYVLTLFSAPSALPAAWVSTDAGRQALASALGELFARYADDPQVMTWDVVNEPEFDVWNAKVSADDMRAFVAAVARSVHGHSSRLVSVGGARLDGLPLLRDLGLDYFTVHWYDSMTDPTQCLACVTYADIRDQDAIDRPILVGEFYGGTSVGGRFDMWHDRGYAGALAWSLLPDRTSDHLDVDLVAARSFAQEIGLA
jgi:hypothetical protein